MSYKLKCEKKFRPRKAKPTPFCRIIRASYEAETERVRYYHPTKGWRSRKATPEFMAMLKVG